MGKKKQSTPSKKLTKSPTANNMKEQLETLMKIINSRVEEYYEEPRYDKTIPLTKVIKELDILEEDVFREGVDSNIAIGTKTGDDKHVFFWPEDILKFLADPHFYLSSKDIKWAFKEIYEPDKGYKLVKVMLHMNLPPFDISIYTLCITEEGFDHLREKFVVNSLDGANHAVERQEESVEQGEENVSPNLNENIFRYKGGRWEIAFDGETIYPSDKEGYRYISYVLSNPRENLHNYRIYQAVNNMVFGLVTEGQQFDAKLYPERATKIKITKEDKADDYQKNKEMIKELDKEDNKLKKEKSELENEGSVDASRLAEIEEELNQNDDIRKAIAADFNSGGKVKTKKEKTTSNVYMNIYRSLLTIKEEHQALYIHLKAFFANGKEYTSYNPDREILWQTNRS